jgi:hypothetical protein
MRGYVKIYFNEMKWNAVDWIPLNQDKIKWQAVVNTVMTEWFPLNAEKFLD